MKSLICQILAAVVLLGALSWAVDGHAVSGDDHLPSISDSQTPDIPEPDRNCDHHCHTASHFVGLTEADPLFTFDDLAVAPRFWSNLHLSFIQPPPGRPPER